MLSKIKSLILINIHDPLLRGSITILIGSFLVGIGNYIFNVITGRLLGPIEYGTLASLLSLTYIMNIPSQTINLTVSRFIAHISANGETKRIRNVFRKSLRKTFSTGLITFVIFLSFSFILQEFLHLPTVYPLIILSFILLLSFVSPVIMGVLGGTEKFNEITANNIISTIVKIALVFVFIQIGWRVEGGLLAFLLAFLIATLYSWSRLKMDKEKNELSDEKIDFLSYGKKAFLVSLCLAALYNVDVILAKHFLEPTEAGYYATLSLLGKLIFFATSAIGVVTFPLSAKNHEAEKEHQKIIRLSIITTVALSALITIIYFAFPKMVIDLLFGPYYEPTMQYLGWMGVTFIFYSLVNLLVLYLLSINRTRFLPFLCAGTLLEIILISYFHQSIGEIVLVMLSIMFVIFISLVPFLITKKKNNNRP